VALERPVTIAIVPRAIIIRKSYAGAHYVILDKAMWANVVFT